MSVTFTATPFGSSPDFQFYDADDEPDPDRNTAPREATDDPFHPSNFDITTFNPTANEYVASNNFSRQTHDPQRAKGVFKGEVISACFDGKPRLVENYNYGQPDYEQPPNIPDQLPSHLVMNVNEVADSDTYFGLLLDPLNKTVISGHVLQVSVVQASQATEEGSSLRIWSQDAIERMTNLVKMHEGKVRNAFIDPYEGRSEHWVDDREYDHPNLRFDIPDRLQNNF